jgi:thiosulfate/3-mercaptopyruvate sulfurtransferase
VTAASRPGLITAAELAPIVAGVTVLDVRWTLAGGTAPEEFAAGHLPGAAFTDLERDLCSRPRADGVGGRHPLPAAGDFAAAMTRLGVRPDRPVVACDAGSGMSAARAWWLLRYFGHPDVRVLDGGLAAWTAAGLPAEQGQPAVAPGAFTAVAGGLPVLAADDLLDPAPGLLLLDARDGVRYRGEVEPVDKVAGHIPGAVSAPTSENVTSDGHFASTRALRGQFRDRGVDTAETVGVYCGSGITAAHEVLALHSIGMLAAMYPGSWSDWISDPARPVATGREP